VAFASVPGLEPGLPRGRSSPLGGPRRRPHTLSATATAATGRKNRIERSKKSVTTANPPAQGAAAAQVSPKRLRSGAGSILEASGVLLFTGPSFMTGQGTVPTRAAPSRNVDQQWARDRLWPLARRLHRGARANGGSKSTRRSALGPRPVGRSRTGRARVRRASRTRIASRGTGAGCHCRPLSLALSPGGGEGISIRDAPAQPLPRMGGVEGRYPSRRSGSSAGARRHGPPYAPSP
jgi:hypothetical protein